MLTGKLALISGASRGIGKSISKSFAKEGASVILVDIEKNFDNTLREVIDAGLPYTNTNHLALTCDVSNSQQVDKLFKDIKESYPNQKVPNVIVNNAGIASAHTFLKLQEKEFDNIVNVNLKSTFLITQKVSQELIANFNNVKLKSPLQTYASIINLASVIGKYGYPTQAHYSSSKAGIEGLTKSVSKELGRYKIRCNAILPGFIDTVMTEPIPKELKSIVVSLTPLQRVGEPDEVAELCLFLASDKSSFITGASIDCNGGLIF